MKEAFEAVVSHYKQEGLYQQITAKLKENGLDLNAIKRTDISAVDEFHVRGAQVSRELATGLDLENKEVLDVGCGIGGPARMLAEVFNCKVTGLDISPHFVRTAKALSALVGLQKQTAFIEGNATALPFQDETFDLVWTQHVQMNIADKEAFYGEIERVLKPGGTFLYYDIFKKGTAEVTYPMPWAETAEISFLSTSDAIIAILKKLGFKKEHEADQTQKGIDFFEQMLAKINQQGPPKLGLNLLMGASTKMKIGNLLSALKNDDLLLESGKYSK